jgi:hypothetical protein
VQAPHYSYREGGTMVDANVAIVEGRRYSFGDLTFTGSTVYPPDQLREEMLDLVSEPYTDRRLADIPRRLEAYFKARGYYDVKDRRHRHAGRGARWSCAGAGDDFLGTGLPLRRRQRHRFAAPTAELSEEAVRQTKRQALQPGSR